LGVTPDRFGPNVFTVGVLNHQTGKPITNVGVTVYTTMSEMGTTAINLLPDGQGHFRANGDLSMAGNWQVSIQVRTQGNTLHMGKVKLLASA
jgi:nitrogen fixation protein FixH